MTGKQNKSIINIDNMKYKRVFIPQWFYNQNIKATMSPTLRGEGHKKEVELYININRETEKAVRCFVAQYHSDGRLIADVNTIGDRWIPKSIIKEE